MASSSYYYEKYKTYRDKVKTLQGNITKLTNIRNSLTNNFYTEQTYVNNELNGLKVDLKKAVRHVQEFNTIADECDDFKEEPATVDTNLYSAVDGLESEISSLKTQKETTEEKRDSYYRSYQREKENEGQKGLE